METITMEKIIEYKLDDDNDRANDGNKELYKESYTIKEVLERYKLKTRQSFYTWANTLGLVIGKDDKGKSIITPNQIKQLDELEKHLRTGGMLRSFIPATAPQIMNNNVAVYSTLDTMDNELILYKNMIGENMIEEMVKEGRKEEETNNEGSKGNEEGNLVLSNYRQLELFEVIVNRVVELMPKSPISHWDELEKACVNSYILTSKEIKELLGVKPFGKEWTRGAFKFTKVGKIGNQSGWLVSKNY
jgi:hypothetical protein